MRRVPFFLFGVVTMGASVPIGACETMSGTADYDGGIGLDGGAGSAGSSGTTGSAVCGTVCDVDAPDCPSGFSCLPSPNGGHVCKSNACPSCAEGTYCIYNVDTCVPDGCGTDACGFALTGACDTCVLGSCCAEGIACGDDAVCKKLIDCAADCSDDACVSTCETGLSEDEIAKATAFSTCLNDHCEAACSAADGGTDGGEDAGCGYLTGCIEVQIAPGSDGSGCDAGVSPMTVQVTNECGVEAYCTYGGRDPFSPLERGATIETTVDLAAGTSRSVTTCGALQPFATCVPLAQAACLDGD